MFDIIFLALFTVSLLGVCAGIYRVSHCALRASIRELEKFQQENQELVAKQENIIKTNEQKEQAALKTMNLYEITKNIGEFLEEEKIVEHFKVGLKNFIHFEECNYCNSIAEQPDVSDFEIIPLASKNQEYGYLMIKGLDERDRPILDILVAQFLVGVKRVHLYELVQTYAITDSLTTVFTRRHFFNRFEEELKRSRELHLDFSFLMIDIDNFKWHNDTYGHLVGDVILKKIADVIRANCREIDLIGRFGGEEFSVALPMTNKDGALFAAERIRKAIESSTIKAFDESLSVTVSIGVASFPQDATTNQELIDKADSALYRSKRTGKNKVSVCA